MLRISCYEEVYFQMFLDPTMTAYKACMIAFFAIEEASAAQMLRIATISWIN